MDFFKPYPDPYTPGRSVVVVPINSSPGTPVTLFAEDYDRWVAEHGIRSLYLHHCRGFPVVFFRTKPGRKTVILARYVAGEPKGRQVSTLDGNLFNLRRDNLIARAGGRGGLEVKPVAHIAPSKRATMTYRKSLRAAMKARP